MTQHKARRTDGQPILPTVHADRRAELRHLLANHLQLVLAMIAKESASTTDPKVEAVLRRLASGVQELTSTVEPADEVELSH